MDYHDAQEYIDVLDERAKDMYACGIVVGFEEECKIVFSSDNHKLGKFMTMILDGGIPLGLIGVKKNGHHYKWGTIPFDFENNEDTAKAEKILNEMCALSVAELIEQTGLSNPNVSLN
jgi:hypothetical protein